MGAVFWMTCKHNCQKSSLWEGFWMDFVVFPPLFDRLCDDTPLKINKEAKIITPIVNWKGQSSSSHVPFWGSICQFLQGLVTFFFKSVLGAVLVVPAAPLDMDHSQKASAMLGSQSKSILIDLQLTHQGLGIIRNDTYSFMKTSPVITKSWWTVFFTTKYDSRYFEI